MAHKDIRIQFTVGGRNYEAVGFLNENEWSVSWVEALARTAKENGGAIGNEDEAFILDHQDKLPIKLRDSGLVTKRCYSDSNPHFVSYIEFEERGEFWGRRGWSSRTLHWGSFFLVLRRLP